uniref:Uncharacterized protein n=1 Tax=Micrurus spixii TaxID=129469 RepID=A0A2D4N8N6_9SAUR
MGLKNNSKLRKDHFLKANGEEFRVYSFTFQVRLILGVRAKGSLPLEAEEGRLCNFEVGLGGKNHIYFLLRGKNWTATKFGCQRNHCASRRPAPSTEPKKQVKVANFKGCLQGNGIFF